jgi:phenylacetate-CoA ligase
MPAQVGMQRLYLRVLDPLPENVAQLNEFRPDVIHANGSHLAELFGYLRKTGAEFHRPRVVTYGSEGVSEAARHLIMEEFGIPVLSAYQTTEAFKLGFECDQHRGYHMNLDLYPVRLVDPQDNLVPVGETGEVIVSNLVNRATVLFNYRLNDLASWLPEACPCGRTLPLLSFLQGRGRDFLRFDTGKLVHPRALDELLTHEPGIWQYQVVQQSGSRVEVDLVVAPDVPREPTRERLSADLGALCGEGVQVTVEFPEALPRTPGGKIRPVVALRDPEAELLGEEAQ